METARPLDVAQPATELRDALANAPPVDLELRLAGPARSDPAPEARQVGPLPCEAREEILELRELDLHLALEAPRALREDVEDERAPVDDLARERLLQVALLRGRERVVEDDDVAAGRLEQVVDVGHLPRTDERRRMDAPELLDRLPDDLEARGVGQPAELLDRLVDRDAALRQVDTDEHGTFGAAGGAVQAGGQRNDSMPLPTTRSTASTTSSDAATRMFAGTAMMVSEPSGRSKCRKASQDPGYPASVSRSRSRPVRPTRSRSTLTWTCRMASARAVASGMISSAMI
jgi:hypothetical protein